jgi:hypothetical protein
MLVKKIRSKFGSWAVFFVVALSVSWIFPIGAGFGRDVTDADKKAYREALEDTEVAEQTEISTRLMAVVPWYDTLNDVMLHGSSITWENPADPERSRVLVETIVDRSDYEKYYEPYIGKETLLTLSTWVTIVPELKNYFIGKACPPTRLRIIQLKGLNPARDYSILLEMWVYPKDLFRPAPDPEITDHEGELSVKVAQDNWTFPSDSNAFLALIDEALYLEKAWVSPVKYKDWFITAAQTYYDRTGDDVSKWGSPWTRLGYAYDWGNADDRLGISEFRVVLNVPEKGLTVKIHGAVDLEKDEERAMYFRCVPEGTGGGDSGCFVKTPH